MRKEQPLQEWKAGQAMRVALYVQLINSAETSLQSSDREFLTVYIRLLLSSHDDGFAGLLDRNPVTALAKHTDLIADRRPRAI